MKFVSLVIAICLIVSVTLPDAFALTREQMQQQLVEREKAVKNLQQNQTMRKVNADYKIIALQLSKSCVIMLKNNVTNTCLTYKQLAKFDTTDQKYSGRFFDDVGYYHRGKPLINNHEIVYRDLNYTVVCVDCKGKNVNQFKTITIEPKKFIFTLDQDRVMTNNTRYEYHDRYVDNCFNARVSNNMTLIEDTIYYMLSGCKVTKYNEKVLVKNTYSKLSYDGVWYKYLKFLEDAKKLKGINCLKSDLC